jgi:hypothetical protein
VLGILIGKGVEESGWNRVTKVMMWPSCAVCPERLLPRLRHEDDRILPSDRAELAGHDPQLAQRQIQEPIMEQNKGFWYADWSFPIFVGLLSSGVFAGTHMYYLYGIGALTKWPSWRC